MSKESSFWNWLRGHLAPLGHFTRIESEVSIGIPDVYFALKTAGRHDGWIELKSVAAPKTDRAHPLKGKKGLRIEQVEWIMRHTLEGVPVFVFAKIGAVVYVFRGMQARRLNFRSFGWMKQNCYTSIPLRRSPSWTRSEFLKVLTRSLADPQSSFPSIAITSAPMARMTRRSRLTSRR